MLFDLSDECTFKGGAPFPDSFTRLTGYNINELWGVFVVYLLENETQGRMCAKVMYSDLYGVIIGVITEDYVVGHCDFR